MVEPYSPPAVTTDNMSVGGASFEPNVSGVFEAQMQFKLWYDADFDTWANAVIEDFDPEDPASIISNELVLATVYSGYSIGLLNGFFILPGQADDFETMENVGVAFCLSEVPEVPEEAPEEVVNQDGNDSEADGDEESGDEGEGAVCF